MPKVDGKRRPNETNVNSKCESVHSEPVYSHARRVIDQGVIDIYEGLPAFFAKASISRMPRTPITPSPCQFFGISPLRSKRLSITQPASLAKSFGNYFSIKADEKAHGGPKGGKMGGGASFYPHFSGLPPELRWVGFQVINVRTSSADSWETRSSVCPPLAHVASVRSPSRVNSGAVPGVGGLTSPEDGVV